MFRVFYSNNSVFVVCFVIMVVLSMGGLRTVRCCKKRALATSGSLVWKCNVSDVIKSFIVGMLVSLSVCQLRVNHGEFNKILRILFCNL